MSRKNKVLLFLCIIMFTIAVPTSSFAKTRLGITAGAGCGLFIAADKEYYGDISTDLYPEIGFQLDASLIRLGLKCAYIYRKVERWGYYSYYDPHWGWYEESYWYEYTLSYLPAQFEVLIAPLDARSQDNIISPYVGLMAGAFIATGDNDKTLPAFSIKAGSEIHLDPLVLYGDIRYTYAPHEEGAGLERGTVNAGGVMIVAGIGLRLDLSR